jgi:autotransporter-associated beta strand protein
LNGTGSFTDTTTTSDALTFSATPVTSGGIVTVVGTQNASGITLNTSGLTFNGGTINTTGQLLINSATSGTINSALTLGNSINFNGTNQTFTLGGGETGTVTVVGGNAAKALSATLQLNGSGATNYLFAGHNIGNPTAGTGGVVLNTGARISYAVASTLSIGNAASGLLTINGGLLGGDSNTSALVGRGGGNGRLILNSGTISLGATRVLSIDQLDTTGGSGRLDVNGGALIVPGNLNIGIQQTGAGGSATLNITNGTVSTGTLHFGNASTAGSGTLNMTGGTLYVGAGGMIKDGTGTFTSSIALSGGIVSASANWSSSMNMTLGSTNGNIAFQAEDSAGTARNISLSGVLSGTGGLNKTGAGVLTLSGVNTYTGDTLVTAGSLVLSSGCESRFAIQNGGESNQFLGTGAITIDDLFRIDMSGLTDTTGTWNLVSVSTLNESFGSNFSLAFVGGPSFTNNNDGTYTSGNWTFSTSDGNLVLVPEPQVVVMLLGGAAFFMFRQRSRRVVIS